MIDDEENFEELYGAWDPTLYLAAMADAQHFALLVGGPRWDDPYTIVLTRDTVNKTFSREDVRRELVDIRVMPSSDGSEASEPSYVTLSRSGDIYVIGPDDTQHTIIPGTLAESEEMPDFLFRSILPYDDKFLVAGGDSFLKLGSGSNWEDVAPFLKSEYPYRPSPDWYILGENREGDIFVVGTQWPDTRHFNLYPGHPLYDEERPDVEDLELQEKLYAERDSYPRLKTLFIGRPGAWKRQALPERIAKTLPPYAGLSDIKSDGKGNDYLIGSEGLIMKGNPRDGFAEIGFTGDRDKNFFAGVFWQDDLILSADSRLYRFDGHSAIPFSPKVKVRSMPYVVQPSTLSVQDGKLYVFDYSLRYFTFDGEEWQQYDLPQELTERPFKGNSPRR